MLSEWQGEDSAEDEEAAAAVSCSVDVEPITVEQPTLLPTVMVDESDAIEEDMEFFLGKDNPMKKGKNFE